MNGKLSRAPSPRKTETRASDIFVGRNTFLVPSDRISNSSCMMNEQFGISSSQREGTCATYKL